MEENNPLESREKWRRAYVLVGLSQIILLIIFLLIQYKFNR